MLLEAKLVTKKGKNGNDYQALEIKFPCGYTKLIFLDQAEQYLLENDMKIEML